MKSFDDILKGGDLRSIGNVSKVVKDVDNQQDFDNLFQGLEHADRKLVMRTADAIEKITIQKPELLFNHKKEILALCEKAQYIELKWHLALIVSRLQLTKKEVGSIWETLTRWANDKKESRIVRVNALQALHNITQSNRELKHDFDLSMLEVESENIPSINARIRKLRKAKG